MKLLSGPRMLNPGAFAKALSGKPKVPVAIWYLEEAPDAWQFAFQLQNALIMAGWTVSQPEPLPPGRSLHPSLPPMPRAMSAGGQPGGITVVSWEMPLKDPALSALFDALMESTDRGAYSGFSQADPVPAGTLRVVIAAKADPLFKLPEWMGEPAPK